MRRGWAAWAWPAMIFAAIPAGLLLLLLVKPYLSDPTPNTPPTPLDPAQHVNTRAWRTISQDPAGHTSDRIVLWGQVTQFDATADPGSFRANVDAARHAPENGRVNYPTSVVMHGDPALLHNLVQGYIFKAEATVDGATTFTTAREGNVTVPNLTVTKISITDKTVG